MTPRTLLLSAALLAAPAALAQQHGGMDHSQMDHGQVDHSQMDHGETALGHDDLLALHVRMMADPTVHARMRADAGLRELMAETMPMDHGEMDHSNMNHSGMDHGAMSQGVDPEAMMARMRERMGAMTDAEHAAFMARFEAAHRRLLSDPEVHALMMADPEARRLMGPLMHGAGHSGMDHSGMDHSGMDHSGMDHAAGVAMQRRNAGAATGDERPATPAVGQASFDASDTADRFHAALAAGDRQAVAALLAPDAVVLEGGGHEARNEYLSDHFARDAAFLAGAEAEDLFRRTTVAGDAAWVASTRRVAGVEMAELLVMRRGDDGWRVAAVHWSAAR